MGIGGYSVFFYEGVTLTGVAVGTAVAIGSGPHLGRADAGAGAARAPVCPVVGRHAGERGGRCGHGDGRGGATLSWSGLALCLLAGGCRTRAMR